MRRLPNAETCSEKAFKRSAAFISQCLHFAEKKQLLCVRGWARSVPVLYPDALVSKVNGEYK